MKKNRKGNSKIYEQIKKSLYNWVIHLPQVGKSQIFNDSMKAKIDGHIESQLVPKLLLQVSVRELHNNIVSNADNHGLNHGH